MQRYLAEEQKEWPNRKQTKTRATEHKRRKRRKRQTKETKNNNKKKNCVKWTLRQNLPCELARQPLVNKMQGVTALCTCETQEKNKFKQKLMRISETWHMSVLKAANRGVFYTNIMTKQKRLICVCFVNVMTGYWLYEFRNLWKCAGAFGWWWWWWWWLFPRLWGFGENVRPFITRLRFFFFFLSLFSFRMEISSRTLIPLLRPGSVNSVSASWDDCGRMFPGELRVSTFRIGSLTMPRQRHSQPTPTSLCQGCMRV